MPSPRNAISDPASAAARGKWLARGAWLLAAAEVVLAVKDHVTDRLTSRERNRIVEIVRSSKGRPSNLSNRERKELQALLAKVEPRGLVKKVATSGLTRRFVPGRRPK
jgi:enhancing lycopene biosynthesis protein 2